VCTFHQVSRLIQRVVCRSVRLRLNRSVRNKLLQAVAVFWKRGWLTESAADKAAFLSNIQVLLTSTGSAAVNQKLMGIHLASELLGQFCHDRSTTISMPLEFHRACREAFKVRVSAMLLPRYTLPRTGTRTREDAHGCTIVAIANHDDHWMTLQRLLSPLLFLPASLRRMDSGSFGHWAIRLSKPKRQH